MEKNQRLIEELIKISCSCVFFPFLLPLSSLISHQKRAMNFRLIDNHKGDTIGAQVEECLHDWGIDKIVTTTVDNPSSNDTTIGYLKRHLRSNVLNGLYIHMRCAVHIMNLVFGDGLKINDDTITRVRDAIRMESDDVDYLPHFTEGECGKRNLGPPTKEDWAKIRVFCKFLDLFYDTTVQFYGSLYVTSHSYFHGLYGVHSHLCRFSQSTDKKLKDMADTMMVKYQKYWERNERLNLLIFIANVIDPRSKLQVMGQMVRLMYGGIEGGKLVASISDLFRALFDEYALGLPQAQVHSSTSSMPLPPPVVAGSGSKLTLFEDYWSTAVSFGTYSSCPSANLEIDRIARDVLAISISTVSSEFAFSTGGGRVLDPFQSSLAPATMKALVCTQDWLRRADEKEPINIKETLDCIENFDMDFGQ